MTFEIALTLGILGIAIVFFVTEWLRADLVALLVLVTLVLTGLVTPEESITGFANPAVVTIWGVFILSAGLSRTGVSSWLGRQVLRLAGRTEARLLSVLMGSSAALSAFMNNIGVAAMFLPVTRDIARRTRRPASRLLMPMAYASLLGGMLTLIGTSSTLVVVAFLPEAGFAIPGMFDFAPVGLAIFLASLGFVLLFGRRLLPAGRTAGEEDGRRVSGPRSAELYGLAERLAVIAILPGSPLVGRTLAESRIGQALGLNVLRVERREGIRRVPDPGLILEAGDRLLVLGRLDAVTELATRPLLAVEEGLPEPAQLLGGGSGLAEVRVAEGSLFAGKTLAELDVRRALGVSVLALRRAGTARFSNLRDAVFGPDDLLLLHGAADRLAALRDQPGFRLLDAADLDGWGIRDHLLFARIPSGSSLAGRTLADTRLGAAFGISVLGVRRDGVQLLPEPGTPLGEGDLLVLEGRPADLDVLRGLQALVVDREARIDLGDLEDGPLGVVEVMLSPHTSLAGRTLRQLRLREKFGVSVLAIWRGDRPYGSDLPDLPLRFGDAFLCHGPREGFELMARERDFVVLDLDVQESPRWKRAPAAALIMAAVVASVVAGHLPIAVAAIAGAAFMVLARCLTMEEAYRSIEWKAVFLIAAMLPLGFAMQRTGAAALLGGAVVGATGPLGPVAVLAGIAALTLAINQFIPSAVNAVVMTPIALATAKEMAISPYPLVMGIVYAVAASFMTPVSHPANVLVMSPGGYRFMDYMKNGLPITLITLAVSVALLPVIFPF